MNPQDDVEGRIARMKNAQLVVGGWWEREWDLGQWMHERGREIGSIIRFLKGIGIWGIFAVFGLLPWSAVCCYLTGHKQCKHQDFQQPGSP
jgi:hypothetical protein